MHCLYVDTMRLTLGMLWWKQVESRLPFAATWSTWAGPALPAKGCRRLPLPLQPSTQLQQGDSQMLQLLLNLERPHAQLSRLRYSRAGRMGCPLIASPDPSTLLLSLIVTE